jgi:uncharacterized protein with NAD-binding domain and iron-sulfur cluster
MADRVAILGGGIAGLSAAHHLARAGVDGIHVYEASDRVGGKARSQAVPSGLGTHYPGEHGFRFFPHFYRHVVDTMATTPAGNGTVFDRLVASTDAGIAFDGRLLDIARPRDFADDVRFIPSVVEILETPGIGPEDTLRYAGVLLQFATSCQKRRHEEYDRRSWFEFARANEYTANFLDLVIKASRNLSAMRAPDSSAATIGAISLQMIFDFEPLAHRKKDPLLDGPTDETWLDPWHAHLVGSGVHFHFGKTLVALDFDRLAGRLRGVRFDDGSAVTADHYVLAVPLDRAAALLSDEMCEFDQGLANVRQLAGIAQGNMVGLQFFLRRDVPIIHGHVHYPRTPFALTSVSQAQFWAMPPDQRPGTPELAGIISAIISDWETPGTEGRAAKDYADRDRLLDEVWRQMTASLPLGTLRHDDRLLSHLDDGITLGPLANRTPLLIHPRGQLALRPDAETAIENLCLASDFVRTNTDLATMEGADEAARRAVRAILTRAGVPADHQPFVESFPEGFVFDHAKAIDEVFFRLGLPHPMESTADALDWVQALGDRHPLIAPLLHPLAPIGFVLDRMRALHPFDVRRPDPDRLARWERLFRRL